MGNIQKVYYDIESKTTQNPFEVKLSLSKRALEYRYNSYTAIDWMIDMGGFSKFMFYGGMAIAVLSAFRLQQADLMQEIFMT